MLKKPFPVKGLRLLNRKKVIQLPFRLFELKIMLATNRQ